MAPRVEFVLLATLAGAALSLAGFLLVSVFVLGGDLAVVMRTALLWSPAGALAALAGAWIGSGWHQRAVVRRGRRWRASGLALRSTVLALLLYPLAASAWLLFTGWLDQRFAAAGMPLRELLNWLPSILLGVSLSALVVGTLPAFVILFALGRRYLRRLGVSGTETA